MGEPAKSLGYAAWSNFNLTIFTKELEMKKLVVSLFCLSAILFLYSHPVMAQSGIPPAPCCGPRDPIGDNALTIKKMDVSQISDLLSQNPVEMNHFSPVLSSNQTVEQTRANHRSLYALPSERFNQSNPNK